MTSLILNSHPAKFSAAFIITITTMHPVIPISARGLRVSFGLNAYNRRRIHATSSVSKSVKDKISEVADKVRFVLPDL